MARDIQLDSSQIDRLQLVGNRLEIARRKLDLPTHEMSLAASLKSRFGPFADIALVLKYNFEDSPSADNAQALTQIFERRYIKQTGLNASVEKNVMRLYEDCLYRSLS